MEKITEQEIITPLDLVSHLQKYSCRLAAAVIGNKSAKMVDNIFHHQHQQFTNEQQQLYRLVAWGNRHPFWGMFLRWLGKKDRVYGSVLTSLIFRQKLPEDEIYLCLSGHQLSALEIRKNTGDIWRWHEEKKKICQTLLNQNKEVIWKIAYDYDEQKGILSRQAIWQLPLTKWIKKLPIKFSVQTKKQNSPAAIFASLFQKFSQQLGSEIDRAFLAAGQLIILDEDTPSHQWNQLACQSKVTGDVLELTFQVNNRDMGYLQIFLLGGASGENGSITKQKYFWKRDQVSNTLDFTITKNQQETSLTTTFQDDRPWLHSPTAANLIGYTSIVCSECDVLEQILSLSPVEKFSLLQWQSIFPVYPEKKYTLAFCQQGEQLAFRLYPKGQEAAVVFRGIIGNSSHEE